MPHLPQLSAVQLLMLTLCSLERQLWRDEPLEHSLFALLQAM